MISLGIFIFIESNTSGTGELLIHKAYTKNLTPILITKEPQKYSFLPMKNLEVITLDTSNKNFLLEQLSKIEGIKGIYSSSEYFVETAAWLAEKLKLPSTNTKVIQTCRNKYLLHKALAAGKIHQPKTVYLCHKNQAKKTLVTQSFPLVIKPNAGSGSVGVKLCQTKQEAQQHINFLFENNYCEILIQEYIEAQEYSVEVCSTNHQHHILGITKKYLTPPPHFIETGHDFPALLSPENEKNIISLSRKVLTLLNFTFGFSHIELKVVGKKIFIIEVNPRLAGGMIPILIQKAKGLDVLDLLLSLYTCSQKNIKTAAYKNHFASIRHFIGHKSGKITGLIHKEPVSVEVKLTKHIGEFFAPQGSFQDRLAYLIVSDEKADQCKMKADEAIKNLTVNIED